MKKIIVLLSLFVFLASCNQQQEVKQSNTSATTQTSQVKQETQAKQQKENPYFQKIKDKISQLEKLGLSQQDAQMIDEQLSFMIERQIEKMAMENISLCSKLSNSDSCIKNIALQKKDSLLCEKLKDQQNKTRCINEILEKKALENLDEKLCLKIVDNTEEKILQKNCKNKVVYQLAIKNKNANLCYKLSQQTEKDMCKQEVKMLKQIEQMIKAQAR